MAEYNGIDVISVYIHLTILVPALKSSILKCIILTVPAHVCFTRLPREKGWIVVSYYTIIWATYLRPQQIPKKQTVRLEAVRLP